MATRQKRSISLPADLADAIDAAASASGTSVSAWLTEAAEHRLQIEAGRHAVEMWEVEHGPLTPEERAVGRARARRLLGRQSAEQRSA